MINVIGAGLAGAECAWYIANQGLEVTLYEMKPNKKSKAHQKDLYAELVCSNSFRSDDSDSNAVGLLHYELRLLNSLVMESADINKVPAGGALAVDRDRFAGFITEKLKSHPLITIINKEIETLPIDDNLTIIATGPLTSDALAQSIENLIGDNKLSFYDAIAPVIYKDSIDFNYAWYQSRYDKGDGTDYLNCPLSKDEYNAFIDALLAGEKVDFNEWEKNTPYF